MVLLFRSVYTGRVDVPANVVGMRMDFGPWTRALLYMSYKHVQSLACVSLDAAEGCNVYTIELSDLTASRFRSYRSLSLVLHRAFKQYTNT